MMKYPEKISIAAILVIVFLSGFTILSRSSAQANTAKASNCTSTQLYLTSTLRDNDLRGRVERLQVYQVIYDEVDALAKRLEFNSQPTAKDMKATVQVYKQSVDQFKESYEIYDAAREKAAKLVDCENNIQQFETALSAMRASRAELAKAIQSTDEIIAEELSMQLDRTSSQLQIAEAVEGVSR